MLKIGRERTEMGRVRLRPVASEKVLQPLMALFQNQAVQKGLDIIFDIADPMPRVLADEGLLEDLCMNLIGNAIKYTPTGGRVRVELGIENHDWVRLVVADTGIGIPEADLPHLFEEFFRAENARKLVAEGTGLGLAIVKEILERLGGKIEVQSKAAEGTIFICLLPLFSRP